MAGLAYFAVAAVAVAAMKRRASSADLVGYVKGQPVALALSAIDAAGHLLRTDAANSFVTMRAAAERDGVQLVVESGFRTMGQQQALWEAYQRGERADVVAQPGWSNHQSGVAVDVVTERGTNAAYGWLLQHAATFGFRRTVGSEPWHWEYTS